MSGSTADSGTNYLRYDSLAGITEASVVLELFWFRRSATHTPGSSQQIADLGAGTSHPSMRLYYTATPELQVQINNNGANGVGDNPNNAAFAHYALHGGPYGTSVTSARQVWYNGTSTYNSAQSANASAGSITRCTLLAGNGGTNMARGAIAEWGLAINPADPAALVALAQIYDVDVLHGMGLLAYRDRLEGAATLFSATGTVTFNSGDHPSLLHTPPAVAVQRIRRRMVGV